MLEPEDTRPFITTNEIVQLANVHPNTVSLWRLTKRIIPRDRIGNIFLYNRQEVLDFVLIRSEKLRLRKEEKEKRLEERERRLGGKEENAE